MNQRQINLRIAYINSVVLSFNRNDFLYMRENIRLSREPKGYWYFAVNSDSSISDLFKPIFVKNREEV
jgi:hypothetical protein